MDALVIRGPARLQGEVRVSGSKNTALPFLFASLLFDREVQFDNVPRLWDIETTLQLMESMGVESSWDKAGGKVRVSPRVTDPTAGYDWVRKMRAGILALGPLVAKCGSAKVSLPGGCAIGARPVDFHIDALRRMGVQVDVQGGYIHAKVGSGGLRGAPISFPQVSVTGTENVLMVAPFAKGTTLIQNAAREPEVVSLGELLIQCGARIRGLGTPTIEVEGGPLEPPAGVVSIPADRIEAGTWIASSVATRSPLTLTHCDSSKMGATLEVFRRMGVEIEVNEKGDTIRVTPPNTLSPIDVTTAPYPGLATDMQAQLLAVLLTADGTSTITESIFENRFMHVAELKRMGAPIKIRGNTAVVKGRAVLKAAPIMATDLRASACLVIAALIAEGETRISRIYHLDRGYQKLDKKLLALGVDVRRVQEQI